MTTLGSVLTLAGSGSWWKEIGGWNASGIFPKVCAGLLAVSATFCGKVFTRAGKEDGYLRQEFRAEWEEWARKVPCMYLPGLY